MGAVNSDLVGNSRHAYLIGVGGAGMSGLARALKHRGLTVSGSDMKETQTVRELRLSGIQGYLGQNQDCFKDADLVIYSSAIGHDHFEMRLARAKGLQVYHRAQILASLFNQARTSLAIMGTHGKTTTSSMISYVLCEMERHPTCLVGGDVLNFGTNAILGDSDLWVAEVDESDKTHELYAPSYAVITNLEEDHLDNYRDLRDLEESFSRFLENPRNPGVVIYNDDDAILKRIVLESQRPSLSFGFSASADFSAQNIRPTGFGSEFDFVESGLYLTPVRLSVPGIHNIANALSAITVLMQLGIDPEEIARHLTGFRGARRRLEVKWQSEDLMVIDDYAHHPTEVKASIRALRSMGGHVTVIFQPHRFSRTRHFCKEFGRAFDEADELILTDVYSAGEANPGAVGVDMIYSQVTQGDHPMVVRVLHKQDITSYLLSRSNPGGIIAFLGAGDIGEVADEFANRFRNLATA